MLKLKLTTLLFAGLVVLAATPSLANQTKVSVDVYAVTSHLMPYKGTQSDLSATLYLKFRESSFRPFLRGVYTKYQYKNETAAVPVTVDDERKAAGGGIDIILNDYFKIRLLSEYIMNKTASTQYSQESYGLIYNQYLNLGNTLNLSNYAEAFSIPRFSSQTIDLFARFQLLKPFSFASAEDYSNAIYPFLQYKVKSNDNAVFGVSGNQFSVGLGYKYYNKNWAAGTLAFLAEAHSVAYQSTDYNGEWAQMLVALQYTYN